MYMGLVYRTGVLEWSDLSPSSVNRSAVLKESNEMRFHWGGGVK